MDHVKVDVFKDLRGTVWSAVATFGSGREVASQGQTVAEALHGLAEAVELYFEQQPETSP